MNFLRRAGSINLILWLAWVLSVEAFLDKSHHPIKKDGNRRRLVSFWRKFNHFLQTTRQFPITCMFFIVLHQKSFSLTSAVGSLKFCNEGNIDYQIKRKKKRGNGKWTTDGESGEDTSLWRHTITRKKETWFCVLVTLSQASPHGSLPINILCTGHILNRHLINEKALLPHHRQATHILLVFNFFFFLTLLLFTLVLLVCLNANVQTVYVTRVFFFCLFVFIFLL